MYTSVVPFLHLSTWEFLLLHITRRVFQTYVFVSLLLHVLIIECCKPFFRKMSFSLRTISLTDYNTRQFNTDPQKVYIWSEFGEKCQHYLKHYFLDLIPLPAFAKCLVYQLFFEYSSPNFVNKIDLVKSVLHMILLWMCSIQQNIQQKFKILPRLNKLFLLPATEIEKKFWMRLNNHSITYSTD